MKDYTKVPGQSPPPSPRKEGLPRTSPGRGSSSRAGLAASSCKRDRIRPTDVIMSMMRVVALLSILALSPQEPETLDALLRALDGDVPEERDRAEEALLEKGEAALPRLRTEAERASGEV